MDANWKRTVLDRNRHPLNAQPHFTIAMSTHLSIAEGRIRAGPLAWPNRVWTARYTGIGMDLIGGHLPELIILLIVVLIICVAGRPLALGAAVVRGMRLRHRRARTPRTPADLSGGLIRRREEQVQRCDRHRSRKQKALSEHVP